MTKPAFLDFIDTALGSNHWISVHDAATGGTVQRWTGCRRLILDAVNGSEVDGESFLRVYTPDGERVCSALVTVNPEVSPVDSVITFSKTEFGCDWFEQYTEKTLL